MGEVGLIISLGLCGAPAGNMFFQTFANCSGLTGQSATLANGKKLYEEFSTATSDHVALCYRGTALSDLGSVPSAWK